MNNQIVEARELVIKAREALRRGDKALARQMGERAALLAPELEDAWLVLAASDPNPQAALSNAHKALRLNPHSTRAQRAVEWATARLPQTGVPAEQSLRTVVEQTQPSPAVSTGPVNAAAGLPPKHAYQTAVAMPALKSQGRSWLLPVLLAGLGMLFIGFVALLFIARPAIASIISNMRGPGIAQEQQWAAVDIAKPEVTPIDGNVFAPPAENTPVPTSLPAQRATVTERATSEPTAAPTETQSESATGRPQATETPGVVAMELLEDTPTTEFIPPTPGISVGNGERWIDVDLTNQMVYAYEGDTVVNSFVVSTGTWLTPTVTGRHKIYVKVRVQDMRGPGYHLRDVPYVMFFHGDYGLHGTYWHNNFGTPMSRGCVNLTIDDAAWLFNWASVGTIVNVHY